MPIDGRPDEQSLADARRDTPDGAGGGATGSGELAGITHGEVAAEAAALGAADGGLADAANPRPPAGGITIGEALGAGAGRTQGGSGVPADHGDAGGGGPAR